MPLIGLHGAAGHGKDTVCDFIKEWGHEAGVAVRREAFADRLKLSAARVFFPDIELEDALHWANGLKVCGAVTVPNLTISGREFLQRYGTEAHRNVFGSEFWVEAALAGYRPDGELLVVTDVRFANEADAIRSRHGFVWKVVRPDYQIAESSHASERPLSDASVDWHVLNDEGLSELRIRVFARMDWLFASSTA